MSITGVKKILIMGDYFHPDPASTGQLLTELCLELQKDYGITVLTSVPSVKMEEYTGCINYEVFQNISLVRVKTKPFSKRSKFSRIKHILEYYRLCRKAIRKIERQDIVFTISQPPILGGLLGLYASRYYKARLVYNIQDFNPEQAAAVGYVKKGLLMKALKLLDTRTCRKSDIIVLVGEDMKNTLISRGIAVDKKVWVINNWIDEEKVYPLADANVRRFKEENGLADKLVFMYSGNIGLYYDIENMVRVIARFNGRKDVVFAFIGDGAKKQEIERWVKENNVNIIKFIPYQAKDRILYSLNAADVHIVASKKGIKGISFPSKIYGVMASGKFALGILEDGSEAAKLIKESGCGVVVEPGDYEKIYSTIGDILNTDLRLIEENGMKGRVYLEKHLKKSTAIEKYRDMLATL